MSVFFHGILGLNRARMSKILHLGLASPEILEEELDVFMKPVREKA